MSGFGLCLGLLATVTLSEGGPVRWADVIGRVRRGVSWMGGGSR